MLDAGNVALRLWQVYLPESSRRRFTNLLQLNEDDTGRLLAFWTALHDIGKASPGFQSKSPEQKARLVTTGITFPANLTPKPHGLITTWALQSLLPPSLRAIGRVLGGHHGNLPTGSEIGDVSKIDQLGRSPIWEEMRKNIFTRIDGLFAPPKVVSLPEDPQELNPLLLLLLGLVVASDWVSSDETRFQFESSDTEDDDYFKSSRQIAAHSVRELGFEGWQPSGVTASFSALFSHRDITTPNAIQQKVINLSEEISPPALVILEAPTGTGKTEAALYLADHWLQESHGRGIYIAMPTTATSNQMFDRTHAYLKQRYPDSLVNLQLVHGQSLLTDTYMSMQLGQIGDDEGGQVAAMSWFIAHKKSLLASFGVGTVDQAFLSVLQSRFFFLRLFGLESKVVIFDEVHAYDTYMSEILDRLLGWLRAVGASVIILSATLPNTTRLRLINAYSGTCEDTLEDVPRYPRITISTADKTSVHLLPIPPEISRKVEITWLGQDADALAPYLRDQLSEGGCAAVICNTVARAQEIYQAVSAAGIVPGEDCYLFHARFPYSWRKETEDKVLEKFGRSGNRPQKAIVIATQVIEQSLDLDFDFLISDLAPIDLIIQRAGRLHRHMGRLRPGLLTKPQIALTRPAEKQSHDPDFGPSEYVYAPYYLDRTWIVLRDLKYLALPEDTSDLIESVYGHNDLEYATEDENTRMNVEYSRLQREETTQIINAKNRLILPPDDEGFFFGGTLGLEEDNPQLHTSFQALTRSAAPGISIICLHRLSDGKLYTDPTDPNTLIDGYETLSQELIKKLLRCAVQISRTDVVKWFAAQPIPSAWQKSAALRYHRVAIFVDGRFSLTGTPLVLQLSRILGLRIEKEV